MASRSRLWPASSPRRHPCMEDDPTENCTFSNFSVFFSVLGSERLCPMSLACGPPNTSYQNILLHSFCCAMTYIFALLGEQHICRSQCHNGPCPPCTKSRIVQCIECKDKVCVDCQNIKPTEEFMWKVLQTL